MADTSWHRSFIEGQEEKIVADQEISEADFLRALAIERDNGGFTGRSMNEYFNKYPQHRMALLFFIVTDNYFNVQRFNIFAASFTRRDTVRWHRTRIQNFVTLLVVVAIFIYVLGGSPILQIGGALLAASAAYIVDAVAHRAFLKDKEDDE